MDNKVNNGFVCGKAPEIISIFLIDINSEVDLSHFDYKKLYLFCFSNSFSKIALCLCRSSSCCCIKENICCPIAKMASTLDLVVVLRSRSSLEICFSVAFSSATSADSLAGLVFSLQPLDPVLASGSDSVSNGSSVCRSLLSNFCSV